MASGTASTTSVVQAGYDVSDRCVLICKPEQSGKTFVMIKCINKDLADDADKHVINFIFSDNSLLLTKQTSARINQGIITFQDSDSTTYIEFSSRKERDSEGNYVAQRTDDGVYGKIMDGVKNVICCTNGKRVTDISKLVKRINKCPHLHNVEIKIWLDEADKFVKHVVNTFEPMVREHENARCFYLTATPEALFKKKLTFTVFPLETTTNSNYHGWDDNNIEIRENIHGGTIHFATQIIDEIRETGKLDPGSKWFIPSDHTKAAHKKMKDDLVLRGFAVIIVNGDGIELDISGQPTDVVKKSDELSIIIRQLYNKHHLENYPLAITGNICVGRGISIMAPEVVFEGERLKEFIFDYGILSDCAKKANASQNAGRLKGNIKDWLGYKPPTVFTTHEFDTVAKEWETCSRELALLAFAKDREEPTVITKQEFKNIVLLPTDDMYDLIEGEFATVDEANSFLATHNCAKTRKQTPTKDGFYETSTTAKKHVREYLHIKQEISVWNKYSNFDIKKQPTYASRTYICYKDLADNTSVVYIVRILIKKSIAVERMGAAAEE
jgi:hypothetical protein